MLCRETVAYRIQFDAAALAAIAKIDAFARQRILDAVSARLRFEPQKPDTNRKRLRVGGLATWELRIHPYRVYYEVDEERQSVWVLRIARKDRSIVIEP